MAILNPKVHQANVNTKVIIIRIKLTFIMSFSTDKYC